MSGTAILQAKGLCYSYGSGLALDQADVCIREGERIAVMGPNGAGKSTFFLLLNGVLRADRGEILLNGAPVTRRNRNDLRRHVGYVFQDPDDQLIASSVAAELSFGPVNLGLPRAEVERRVEQALQYMDLAALRDRPPQYLSGGEKKRVSIAGILAMRPDVILFDEPAASLDPQNALALEETLERLHREGKTLVISTHDVDFALRWADRLLVFQSGRIIADGIPSDVFRDGDVLRRAHLTRPVLLQVCELLAQRGILPHGACPSDLSALEALLNREAPTAAGPVLP